MTTALTGMTFSTRHPLRFSSSLLVKFAFIATLALVFSAPTLSYAKQTKPHARKDVSAHIKVGAKFKGAKNSKIYAKSNQSKHGKLTLIGRTKANDKLSVRVKGNRVFIHPRLLKDAKGRPLKGKALIAAKRRAIILAPAPVVQPKPSFGELAGLHQTQDALELKSGVALVVDQDTKEVLFSKNDSAVLPIASLTKLMTGLIVQDARLPLNEIITITQDDVDTEKGSRSRLVVGTSLTRGEMLHLALMSSENRAANALGRTYPNGLNDFVRLMNAKAKSLGMRDTIFVEPTGLSSKNQSSAHDLALLASAVYQDAVLRNYSISPGYEVAVGEKTLQFNNTNRLTKNPDWDIGLQKTGYISEAGRCLIMQTKIAGRKLIMVFLDSAGKFSRLGDAERVRRWVESNPQASAPLRLPRQS
ncbi:MAG TPA: serine hydrolase [Burkholderiaceae bacterium]|nr:serine hydrolase [Burkholderiaceae bacterium]